VVRRGGPWIDGREAAEYALGMKKPIAIKLEEGQLAWVRSHAASLRRTMTSVIEEALDDYKAKHENRAKGSHPPRGR
jgi:hypothetical protein